jgi:hypothetical protein
MPENRYDCVESMLVLIATWICFLFVLYLSIEADGERLYHYRVE